MCLIGTKVATKGNKAKSEVENEEESLQASKTSKKH